MKSNLTLSVGWVGGGLEILRLRLILTQVGVEVGFEFGNIEYLVHMNVPRV